MSVYADNFFQEILLFQILQYFNLVVWTEKGKDNCPWSSSTNNFGSLFCPYNNENESTPWNLVGISIYVWTREVKEVQSNNSLLPGALWPGFTNFVRKLWDMFIIFPSKSVYIGFKYPHEKINLFNQKLLLWAYWIMTYTYMFRMNTANIIFGLNLKNPDKVQCLGLSCF